MKTIYAKDIKAMVKKFNLNEDESWYLTDLANEINKSKEMIVGLQEVLLYGTSIDEKRNAINALLIFFGAKVQKENDLRMKLRETTWKLAEVLKCGSYQIQQWFKRLAINKDRFGKYVECSTTYGLNYLEIEF